MGLQSEVYGLPLRIIDHDCYEAFEVIGMMPHQCPMTVKCKIKIMFDSIRVAKGVTTSLG